MRSVWLDAFTDDIAHVTIRDTEVPKPGRGQIRVRMRLAPINPSDFNNVHGTYDAALRPLVWNIGEDLARYAPGGDAAPVPPYALGVEGVGVVEEAGGGWLGRRLVGKRVAVASGPPNGTWQEHTLVDARRAIPVSRAMSDEQACSFFVNPLTALAMVQHVCAVPAGAWVLQTAAGSALGGMVRGLAKLDGFRVINVVRSEAGAERLRADGAEHVVATETGSLIEAVKRIAPAGVQYALDCVGGPLGSEVIRCLTPHGKLVCYGTLSREPLSFSPRDIMMPTTQIEGFYLPAFLNKNSLLQRLRIVRQTAKLIQSGVLATPVQEVFSLDDVQAALRAAQAPGRSGKILLRLGN